MPELPDVELYLAALRPRILGKALERVRLGTPFLLRSVEGWFACGTTPRS